MTLPAGYSLRRPTPSDAEAVAAMVTVADPDADPVKAADVERKWRGLDVDNDVWLVEAEANGDLAAYAELLRRSEDHVASQGFVAPEHLGRGLGAAVLTLLENRAREVVPRGRITNGVLRSLRPAVALLEQSGYQPVRNYLRMAIDLREEPPEPRWPAGLEPRRFDREHGEAFHAAMEHAFAEEWGHEPEPFEVFRSRRVDAPEASLDLWLGVWDGDELAATLICDRRRYEMGWIASVGVRPAWRRRGLGLALLHHAFGEFWRRGERGIGLGVDADNLTGASRLYERAGMRVVFDAVIYEKRLSV